MVLIDGKAAEHRCRDHGVAWKLTSNVFWKIGTSDAERAERIETGKLRGCNVDENEDLRNVFGHILPGLLAKIAIEYVVARRECGSVVMLPERFELICRD